MFSAERQFPSFARRLHACFPLGVGMLDQYHVSALHCCTSSTRGRCRQPQACSSAAAALQACKLRNFRQLDCTAKRPRVVAVILSQELRQRDCTTRRRSGGVGEASNASVGAESFGHGPQSPYASHPFGGSFISGAHGRGHLCLTCSTSPFSFFWNTVADAGR